MRNATKMMMIAERRKQKGGNQMRENYRGGRSYYPMYEEPEEDMYDEMEMRRRRDRRGRFTSEMEMRGERGGNRQARQIGFRQERGERARMGGGGRGEKMEMGGAEEMEGEMDEDTAEEWMESLENEDGTKGPHWKMEQTERLMEQRGIECDPVEFWCAINIMYSDYSKVARAHGVNKVEFYADLAKAFLKDKDAVDGKLMVYYECVVK